MRARRSWTIVGLILCVAVFVTIAAQLRYDALHALDLAITQALYTVRTPLGTTLLQGMTALCAPTTLLIFCLVLMFMYRKRHYSIPVAINLMVSVSLNYTLKNVFLRERPPLLYRVVSETGYSFPSGHAMTAGAFYGFLIYLVLKSNLPKPTKRILTTLLVLIIGIVGFSRVYLGVHYLSDVVAGFAISIAYLLVYCNLVGLYLQARKTPLPILGVPQKNKRITDSFVHAFEGVAEGFKGERNMIIHFAMMALVTVFGFLWNISKSEWLVCVTLFGMVIGTELINTAIESTVDLVMPHNDPRAKLAKDTAAGAVLLVSIAAAVAGAIIFLPKLWPMLW